MDEVKTTTDVDDALEIGISAILDFDTVAIWDNDSKMYGVYVKGDGEALWWLTMTSLTVDKIINE